MPSFGYLSRGELRFFAVFLDFLPSYLSLNFIDGFRIIETEAIFVKLAISFLAISRQPDFGRSAIQSSGR
ncbi:MAG UNVERIFIED_CONTAM: hypothetical protein LVR29_07750 [Microcystis novacekii LVE1205-3]|jgi:hypothetical protein